MSQDHLAAARLRRLLDGRDAPPQRLAMADRAAFASQSKPSRTIRGGSGLNPVPGLRALEVAVLGLINAKAGPRGPARAQDKDEDEAHAEQHKAQKKMRRARVCSIVVSSASRLPHRTRRGRWLWLGQVPHTAITRTQYCWCTEAGSVTSLWRGSVTMSTVGRGVSFHLLLAGQNDSPHLYYVK